MSRRLIIVYGPTGSGKDTLITHLIPVLRERGTRTIRQESSINVVKQMFQTALAFVPGEDVEQQEYRQGLADVKKVLDRVFNWTVRFGMFCVPGNGVLIYQVREPQNIRGLQGACLVEGINCLAVYVRRPGFDGRDGADTDVYTAADIALADVVIDNVSLTGMPHYAETVLSHLR